MFIDVRLYGLRTKKINIHTIIDMKPVIMGTKIILSNNDEIKSSESIKSINDKIDKIKKDK